MTKREYHGGDLSYDRADNLRGYLIDEGYTNVRIYREKPGGDRFGVAGNPPTKTALAAQKAKYHAQKLRSHRASLNKHATAFRKSKTARKKVSSAGGFWRGL